MFDSFTELKTLVLFQSNFLFDHFINLNGIVLDKIIEIPVKIAFEFNSNTFNIESLFLFFHGDRVDRPFSKLSSLSNLILQIEWD